jgi:hypothetical protein
MSLLLYNGAKVNGVSEVTAPLLSVIFYGDLGIDKKNHINIDVVKSMQSPQTKRLKTQWRRIFVPLGFQLLIIIFTI